MMIVFFSIDNLMQFSWLGIGLFHIVIICTVGQQIRVFCSILVSHFCIGRCNILCCFVFSPPSLFGSRERVIGCMTWPSTSLIISIINESWLRLSKWLSWFLRKASKPVNRGRRYIHHTNCFTTSPSKWCSLFSSTKQQ